MLAAQWAQLSQEEKQVSPFLHRMGREVAQLPAASIRGCLLPFPAGHWRQRELSGMQARGASHPTP